MDDVDQLEGRLHAVRPQIEAIMEIGGAPGAALGVLQQGKIVYLDNIGFRDVEKKLPVTEETIFPCASLTKAVVSAAMGICVEEKKFHWDTPVKEILPEFHTRDKLLHHHMTMADCLCHRAGMQASLYWLGSQNNVLIANDNSMRFLNDLQRLRPFRDQYLYNNLGYEIAAHVLARVTGKPWEDIIHTEIFQKLDMTRSGTRFGFDKGDDNVAKAYATLDDASPVNIAPMQSGDNTVGGPGSAMRSCMKDLLRLYTAFLEAGMDQLATGLTSTPQNPLKQVSYLFSPRISMSPTAYLDTSYALGWARVQTPGPMGAIGLNPDLLSPKPPPNVARNHPSELVLYHQGSMPGVLAAVNIVPRTKGAIVVLTNSLALNDTADWIGELLLESYLGVEQRHDYVSLARETASSALQWYPRISRQLQEQRIPGTSPRPLSDYTGIFYNEARTMMISIFFSNDATSLKLSFQGLDSEVFALKHYHYDVFTWLEPRNALACRGRFTNTDADYFKISFMTNDTGSEIDHFGWQHDKYLPEPERYNKEGYRSFENTNVRNGGTNGLLSENRALS